METTRVATRRRTLRDRLLYICLLALVGVGLVLWRLVVAILWLATFIRFLVGRRLAPLYGLLLGIVGVLIALFIVYRPAGWTSTWLPNFIAEFSGIFIAVAIVDRMIESDRRRRDEELVRPLLRNIGRKGRLVLERFVPELSGHRVGWPQAVADPSLLGDELRRALDSDEDDRAKAIAAIRSAAADLDDLRDAYVAALPPHAVHAFDNLVEAFAGIERSLTAARQSTFSVRRIARLTHSIRPLHESLRLLEHGR